MMFGDFSCRDVLPVIHTLGVINIIILSALFLFSVYHHKKVLKDNSILARMLHKISGDLPN